MFYGLFQSIAVYAIIGWEGIYAVHLEPLDRLQKRIFNIVEVNENDRDCPLTIKEFIVVNSIIQ